MFFKYKKHFMKLFFFNAGLILKKDISLETPCKSYIIINIFLFLVEEALMPGYVLGYITLGKNVLSFFFSMASKQSIEPVLSQTDNSCIAS